MLFATKCASVRAIGPPLVPLSVLVESPKSTITISQKHDQTSQVFPFPRISTIPVVLGVIFSSKARRSGKRFSIILSREAHSTVRTSKWKKMLEGNAYIACSFWSMFNDVNRSNESWSALLYKTNAHLRPWDLQRSHAVLECYSWKSYQSFEPHGSHRELAPFLLQGADGHETKKWDMRFIMFIEICCLKHLKAHIQTWTHGLMDRVWLSVKAHRVERCWGCSAVSLAWFHGQDGPLDSADLAEDMRWPDVRDMGRETLAIWTLE